MFTFLDKVVSYFKDTSDDLLCTRPNLEEFKIDYDKSENYNFEGFITNLDETGGVINDDIYFSLSVVINVDLLEIGEKVIGIAQRSSNSEAWCAHKVEVIVEDWNDAERNPELKVSHTSCAINNCRETSKHEDSKQVLLNGSNKNVPVKMTAVIGQVMDIYENLLSLNCDISVCFTEDTCSFKVMKGDFVRCFYEETANCKGSVAAVSIMPLILKCLRGKVTHVCKTYCVVNNEIYCNKNVLGINDCHICDDVEVEVIESHHCDFLWRAINFKIILSHSVNKVGKQVVSSSVSSYNNKCDSCSDKIIKSKNGIAIYGTELLPDVLLGTKVVHQLTLINNAKDDLPLPHVTFQNSKIGRQFTVQGFFSDISKRGSVSEFKSSQNVTLEISFHAKYLGFHKQPCIIDFGHFKMISNLSVNVAHELERSCFDEKSKFAPQAKKEFMPMPVPVGQNIIKGQKPLNSTAMFLPKTMSHYVVPDDLWSCVLAQDDILYYFPYLHEHLSPGNYTKFFSILLHLEEIAMVIEMQKYAVERETFIPVGEYLSLSVPGLSEKRPSLLIGDTVLASVPADSSRVSSDLEYEGYVHEVLNNKVLLKFHQDFHTEYKGEDYSLRFQFNRTPLRRCHFAVRFAIKQLGPEVFFPTELKFSVPQICFVDPELSYNSVKASEHLISLCNNEDQLDDCDNAFKKSKVTVSDSAIYPGFVPRILEIKYGKKVWNGKGDEKAGADFGGLNKEKTRPYQQQDPQDWSKDSADGYCLPTVYLKSCRLVPDKIPVLKWCNQQLNVDQKMAVRRILEGISRPIPYLIFGPPGTGKTVTLVEAALQIHLMVTHSRILITTPSNSASDLISERLVTSGKIFSDSLVRLNAYQRSEARIPDVIKEHCCTLDTIGVKIYQRIIVATAITLGSLYTLGLSNGHFTHVLIDEAGQLTEPETCISLGFLNKKSGQVVLAGDPKQLGPVVQSSLAKKFGLKDSLLHRLYSSVLYQPAVNEHRSYSFEPSLVTMLTKTYRCHPDIIAVPSKLFYSGAVFSSISERLIEKSSWLMTWPDLPNHSHPILFHGILSENCQEGNSPSWFNPTEAFQIVIYTKSLLDFGVHPCEIGIITPYRKQVEKIQKLMESFGIENEGLKVSSVEDFQGQERTAILISTVRSSAQYLQDDARYNLGFVSCPRRFNVAVTRAQALLVLVGNPYLLAGDPYWREFILYCMNIGSYVGPDIDDSTVDFVG